jgi:indole-3-glycerol phosphate synthase
MPVSLEQIVSATRLRVATTRQSTDLRKLERRAQAHTPRGFRSALEARSKDGIGVIAELKKASPSRGLIRAGFDPETLAAELEAAGAAALSVLTDEEFFQGSLENLRLASLSTALPCLRKDFIVDEFQLLEARADLADAVLLIVATLSSNDLKVLTQRAADLDLDVLCEVHDRGELDRALDTGCDLIGVNNRDLKTFKVDPQTAFRLAPRVPANALSVAESGINSGADIARLRAAGYGAFLIGEFLMKAQSPGRALSALISEASVPVSS